VASAPGAGGTHPHVRDRDRHGVAVRDGHRRPGHPASNTHSHGRSLCPCAGTRGDHDDAGSRDDPHHHEGDYGSGQHVDEPDDDVGPSPSDNEGHDVGPGRWVEALDL